MSMPTLIHSQKEETVRWSNGVPIHQCTHFHKRHPQYTEREGRVQVSSRGPRSMPFNIYPQPTYTLSLFRSSNLKYFRRLACQTCKYPVDLVVPLIAHCNFIIVIHLNKSSEFSIEFYLYTVHHHSFFIILYKQYSHCYCRLRNNSSNYNNNKWRSRIATPILQRRKLQPKDGKQNRRSIQERLDPSSSSSPWAVDTSKDEGRQVTEVK